MKIALADSDAEIAPVPTEGGGRKPEVDLDRLSNILKTFNDNFGTLFDDADRVIKRIGDVPALGCRHGLSAHESARCRSACLTRVAGGCKTASVIMRTTPI